MECLTRKIDSIIFSFELSGFANGNLELLECLEYRRIVVTPEKCRPAGLGDGGVQQPAGQDHGVSVCDEPSWFLIRSPHRVMKCHPLVSPGRGAISPLQEPLPTLHQRALNLLALPFRILADGLTAREA